MEKQDGGKGEGQGRTSRARDGGGGGGGLQKNFSALRIRASV